MSYGSIKSNTLPNNNNASVAVPKHENALLKSPAPLRRRSSFCSVKSFLSIALVLALLSIIGVITTLDEDHWVLQAWELGWAGHSAQRIADASRIHSSKYDDKLSQIEDQLDNFHQKNKKHNKEINNISTTGGVPDGCESTVMLIRHCEKQNLKSHCDFIGYERSAYLATIFGDEETAKWPAPFKMYALKAGRKHGVNYREIETVQAIADKINKKVQNKNDTVVINQEYSTHDQRELAGEVLQTIMQGDMCGKLTLISWKHSELPRLASLMGCGPVEGCPMEYKGSEFDTVYQIKYIYKSFHTDTMDGQLVKPHWKVFGNIQHEQFDPLAFSKSVGDYPARTEKKQTGPEETLHWKTDNTTLYEGPSLY